jgi:hypothetical protein
MEKRVTPHEVTADFEALLDRARERGETLVVERDGKVLCRIFPAGNVSEPYTGADFLKLLRTLPPVDPEFANDVQAVIDSQPVEVPRSLWE